MVQNYISVAIEQHGLPAGFAQTVETWYRPLAEQIHEKLRQKGAPFILGVQGTQGSGKSTLADFLCLIFNREYGLNAVTLSIDDFYLTLAERQQLAKEVHPLLVTRGVPGSHDLPLAQNTLDTLTQLEAGQAARLPRFNKAIDDRANPHSWPSTNGPLDLIILEGWCVGMTEQALSALEHPVNDLERLEDRDGTWRRYVNDQLGSCYPQLFSRLDALTVLKAPSFACVYNWRLLQEEKLASSLANASPAERSKLLSPAQVERFISHYQRLTEHGLQTLPSQADWLLELNEDHHITCMKSKQEQPGTLIVATDLDGTLLDHHNYDWAPAAPALDRLKAMDAPVIINTSKTVKEVLLLQAELNIEQPFVVENGSALLLPKSRYPRQPEGTETLDDHWLKLFGKNRSQIIERLQEIRQEFSWSFVGFNDMSLNELVSLTNLPEANARLAMSREFSEPIVWQDNDTEFVHFKQLLESEGLRVIRGGRFVHILGATDKGLALLWFKKLFEDTRGCISTLVALGDSPNDIDMLKVADYAVSVRSPAHDFPEFETSGQRINTTKYGPAGWTEAIDNILNQLK